MRTAPRTTSVSKWTALRSIPREIRHVRKLVRHLAVAAASGHLVLPAPSAVKTQPVFEHPRHHEADGWRIENSRRTHSAIRRIYPLQLRVQFHCHLRASRCDHRPGFQLDPPFVAAA